VPPRPGRGRQRASRGAILNLGYPFLLLRQVVYPNSESPGGRVTKRAPFNAAGYRGAGYPYGAEPARPDEKANRDRFPLLAPARDRDRNRAAVPVASQARTNLRTGKPHPIVAGDRVQAVP